MNPYNEVEDLKILGKIRNYCLQKNNNISIDSLRVCKKEYLNQTGKNRLIGEDWPEFLKYLGKELGGLSPGLEKDLVDGSVAATLFPKDEPELKNRPTHGVPVGIAVVFPGSTDNLTDMLTAGEGFEQPSITH